MNDNEINITLCNSQNSVDELINKAVEKKDDGINITLCNSQNSVDELINKAIIKKDNQSKLDEYKNSQYYQVYLNYCGSIQSSVEKVIQYIYYKYCYNKYLYINPFNKKLDCTLYILGIGFPVPEEYISNIKNLYENILDRENIFEDGEFVVDIIPAEYLKTGETNFIKKGDSYIINIELKQKKIDKNKINVYK